MGLPQPSSGEHGGWSLRIAARSWSRLAVLRDDPPIPLPTPSTPGYCRPMGIFKDAKSNMLGEEARKAADAGAAVFSPRLNLPSSMHNMSGNVADWSLMIQAIEAQGWSMVHWSVAMDAKGRPEAYPLFRRA